MEKFYDYQDITGRGFNAQALVDSFIPSVNTYLNNVEDVYNHLISACIEASDKYSLCDFGSSVSSNYSLLAKELDAAKNQFSAQIESANKQIYNYVEQVHKVEMEMIQATDETDALIRNIRNRDYTQLYESSLNNNSSSDGDLLNSVEFSDSQLEDYGKAVDALNRAQQEIESVDYSEFSSKDED